MAAQNMPPAEVHIDEPLVRRLLVAQAPHLAGSPLRLLANGWDNVIYRLGEHLTVRLPRRALAVPLIEHEQRWLGLLAPLLPLPIPAPVLCGAAGEGFPWPWSVCPWFPGASAAAGPPTDPFETAERLGAFLAALHRPAPADAPPNDVRGVALAERDDAVRSRLALLDAVLDAASVGRRWSTLVDTAVWHGEPCWLHGDLHPANLLVHDGTLHAVIDFGDLTSGDPATDLAVAWMLLPAAARPVLRRAAGGVDDDTWCRAQGWALNLALAFLANSADNPLLEAIGRRTLDALLTSDT